MSSKSEFADGSAVQALTNKTQMTAPESRTLPEPTKRPSGRPSKYEPAFCERVIELATSEGLSWGACAGEIGVSRQTLTAWAGAHPEFLDAKRVAEARSQLFWERKLSKLADQGSAGPGASTAIIFALKNRAKDDWRDTVEQRHVGDPSIPVIHRIERVIVTPSDHSRMLSPLLEGP
jgi:transposase-like protein